MSCGMGMNAKSSSSEGVSGGGEDMRSANRWRRNESSVADFPTKVGSSMIATATFASYIEGLLLSLTTISLVRRPIISRRWTYVASLGLSDLSALRTESSNNLASYSHSFDEGRPLVFMGMSE